MVFIGQRKCHEKKKKKGDGMGWEWTWQPCWHKPASKALLQFSSISRTESFLHFPPSNFWMVNKVKPKCQGRVWIAALRKIFSSPILHHNLYNIKSFTKGFKTRICQKTQFKYKLFLLYFDWQNIADEWWAKICSPLRTHDKPTHLSQDKRMNQKSLHKRPSYNKIYKIFYQCQSKHIWAKQGIVRHIQNKISKLLIREHY